LYSKLQLLSLYQDKIRSIFDISSKIFYRGKVEKKKETSETLKNRKMQLSKVDFRFEFEQSFRVFQTFFKHNSLLTKIQKKLWNWPIMYFHQKFQHPILHPDE
jgi:hypothetical protein